jgi:hypothetical protein
MDRNYIRVSAWVVHCRTHERTIQGFVAGKWRTVRHYPSKCKVPKSLAVHDDAARVLYANTDPHVTRWFRLVDVVLEFDGQAKEPDVVVHCWGCGLHGAWEDCVKTQYGPGDRGACVTSRACTNCGAPIRDKNML